MNLLKEFVYRLRGDYTTERLIKMGLVVGRNFKRLQGTTLDPSHCWLISIGDDVTLAPNVTVLAHDASMWTALGYTKIAPVTIGNRVFIGAGTVVLPGVTIGDDVIIGANSTVTRDIPSGSVYAGNPAKLIKTTEAFLDEQREKMYSSPSYGEEYTLRGKVTDEKKEQMKTELQNGVGYIQ